MTTTLKSFRFSPVACLLIVALALGWLLPNHYAPWLAFHSNAWVGIVLILFFLWGVIFRPIRAGVDAAVTFLFAVSLIPLLQYAFGTIPLRSDAFLLFLYLFGAATAYWLARAMGGHPVGGAGALVLCSMGIASIASVGIATYQWLGLAQDLGFFDIWILAFVDQTRPYANIGQTNQLASLLLCGLLSVAWGWRRGFWGAGTSILAACWILWGVALTESRTALLTLAVAMILLVLIRPAALSRREIYCVMSLFAFYMLALFAKPALAEAIGIDMPLTILERSAGELRWSLWKMAFDASLASPFWGVGWGRSNVGYFLVYENYQQIFGNSYFEQSHNIILDLALWVGWPLAICILSAVGYWFWRVLRKVKSDESMILLAAMFVLGTHAMLELPLHYGYFLWPFFVFAGSLSLVLQDSTTREPTARKPLIVLLLTTLLVVSLLIVKDYLKIEQAFTELRFQVARVGSGHDETLPDTLILSDWPDVIALARSRPRIGMSQEEIAHWEALLAYHTSPLALRKVIGAHRLNGHESEARAWATRACWLLNKKACQGLLDEWPRPDAATLGSASGSNTR
ncbi:MAG: Wzy polymerase domain-containing protein [Burkholderiaceae bacterium]